tara:strand:- start:2138 stop:3040 length:903 start_codon:yes stop_codon:yes gene_type:complete
MNEELLHKYLNNEITEAELEQLKATDIFRDYIQISEFTSNLQAPAFDKESAWKQLSKKVKKESKVISLFNYKSLLKYAAVLALIVTGFLYVTNLSTTLTAPLAEKKSFTLPDQSEVVLNAGSKIKYSKKSWDKQRTLTLDGEAYFKVAKGETFDVNTTQGVVSVLGTQFNVQSRGTHFHVTCYEGKVAVVFNTTNIQLSAGDSVIIEEGEIISQQKVSTLQPGWMFDESSFENKPLWWVIEELQRQYKVTVTFENIDKNTRFTGAFTHTNLDAALKTICMPMGLTYTINQNGNVLIYGAN